MWSCDNFQLKFLLSSRFLDVDMPNSKYTIIDLMKEANIWLAMTRADNAEKMFKMYFTTYCILLTEWGSITWITKLPFIYFECNVYACCKNRNTIYIFHF